jgi:hypothetical protein
MKARNDHLLEGEWEEPDSIDIRHQSEVGRVPHVDTRVTDGAARDWARQREGRERGSWPTSRSGRCISRVAGWSPKTEHGKVNRGGPRGALEVGNAGKMREVRVISK